MENWCNERVKLLRAVMGLTVPAHLPGCPCPAPHANLLEPPFPAAPGQGMGWDLAARPFPARALGIPATPPQPQEAASQGCFQLCKNIHLHTSARFLHSAFFFFLINKFMFKTQMH